jgi:membrane-bound lytic murein transglycosylase B
MKTLWLIALWALWCSTAFASYAERPEVQAFMRELVKRHGFVEAELKRVFAHAKRADPVLEAIARPAERVRTWEEYRAALLTERRIAEGMEFWKKYRRTLERAEKKYGVAPEYIVAIIGVEAFYGRNTGNWRVVDALTTLAFDYPPRAGFFRNELEQYLLFARKDGIDVFSVRGSYAGAIGLPQFMPSSTRAYAVDFDGNGHIDLQKSRIDAIGSVANFLKVHGWQRDADVLVDARVAGDASSRGTRCWRCARPVSSSIRRSPRGRPSC